MELHEIIVVVSYVLHGLAQLAFILRVLLRPNRQPSARVAWIAVILSIPLAGIVAYILLGETNVGRRRAEREREILARLPGAAEQCVSAAADECDIPADYRHLFRVAKGVNGFRAVSGNRATLLADSNAAIDAIVADIDAAKDHVHLLFYIWLTDTNGLKVVEALTRAAGRGVTCRAMADGLGSRLMIKSKHWKQMRKAGVRLAAALPIGNILLRAFRRRVDLRNHRKMVVVDGRVLFCGSQNCADPEFRVKAKYAPWVDAMMRFEGPIVQQMQHLFATDWRVETDEDVSGVLRHTPQPAEDGFVASVVGTGPTVRDAAMPEMFEALMYTAREELVISTPYYVPDEAMQTALCASARRGVRTTIVFPARNDSWFVGAASRSYYLDLLRAGVRVFEYEGGLLHTKSLTLDGQVTLIGSANMDRRSFDLDYENNVLFCDADLTGDMRRRQEEYIENSRMVEREDVEQWSLRRRLWNNGLAMLSPVL